VPAPNLLLTQGAVIDRICNRIALPSSGTRSASKQKKTIWNAVVWSAGQAFEHGVAQLQGFASALRSSRSTRTALPVCVNTQRLIQLMLCQVHLTRCESADALLEARMPNLAQNTVARLKEAMVCPEFLKRSYGKQGRSQSHDSFEVLARAFITWRVGG